MATAENYTPRLPPFVSSTYHHITIITLLTESLTSMNASWMKEKILDYVETQQTQVIVINLCNVSQVDRMGMSALLSLNSRLAENYEWTLACLQEQVQDFLEQAYMMHMFRHIALDSPCPISPEYGGDQATWQKKLNEFRLDQLQDVVFETLDPSDNDPYPVQSIRRISKRYTGQLVYTEDLAEDDFETFPYEQDPEYIALEKRRQRKEFFLQIRNYAAISIFSALLVGAGVTILFVSINSDLLKFLEDGKRHFKRPRYDANQERVLPPAEIIERYDKDGDGQFTQEDWLLLNSQEKLIMINHGFHRRKEQNSDLNFEK